MGTVVPTVKNKGKRVETLYIGGAVRPRYTFFREVAEKELKYDLNI